jgi:SAM-dependent methyltransferase
MTKHIYFLIRIRNYIRSFFYKGKNYYCPICQKHSRLFFTSKDGLRKNAVCPSCGSFERQRFLMLVFNKYSFINPDKYKMLDIAPSFSLQKVFKGNRNIEYTSFDIASCLADIKGDITSMPFGDSSFDIIICSHVLEHIENDMTALSEIKRVLKTNGKAFIQIPLDKNLISTFEDKTITSPEQRKECYGQSDHVRIYGLDFSERLEKTGLNCQIVNCSESFDESLIRKYCLLEDEQIFVCTKQ